MENTNKRTPSRCREWEKQRRNKFNDAISKLGEAVKAVNKAKDPRSTENENVQYPKIEIVQQAILCLTNCTQERTQLKAEILALQVKLESATSIKGDSKDACAQVLIQGEKRDVSTQVFIGVKKKGKNSKYVKLLMLQKSKKHTKNEKFLTATTTTESRSLPKQILKEQKILPKIKPALKAPDNTIVVLPAAPYIFPQRQLLFPSIAPAFVVVNPNIPSTNKPSVPVVTRHNSDITKTTMVNILPISAYSRPLSAKNKKSIVKLKNNNNKRNIKKNRPVEVSKASTDKDQPKTNEMKTLSDHKPDNVELEALTSTENISQKVANNCELAKPLGDDIQSHSLTLNENTEKPNCPNPTTKQASPASTPPTTSLKETVTQTNIDSIVTTDKSIESKTNTEPVNDTSIVNIEVPEKSTTKGDKESKLPNILETSLCDGTVDGGNARLELAEELLAASPTAAFLMSFPLVSGNRADSPAEDAQSSVPIAPKENNQRRREPIQEPSTFFDKHNVNLNKIKPNNKATICEQEVKQKPNPAIKELQPPKTTNIAVSTANNENPFLNLSVPSIVSTNYTPADPTFGIEFDCNMNKTLPNQTTTYSNNLFYKGDPFSSVKNAIYSTSTITSTHEFNSLGLYPCAMEKYTSKSKSDFSNVDENLMKLGSARLTYDIDLGWSHKGLDFVNCTTNNATFSKDILTTVSAPCSTTYNPFNPEFHIPLVSNAKENITNKGSSFVDTISSLYSQPTNLWTEESPFYSNNGGTKSLNCKPQYLPTDPLQTIPNAKVNEPKIYDTKVGEAIVNSNSVKPILGVNLPEKYTKKSPSKMHINWMTSEIRPMQNYNHTAETKDIQRTAYNQLDQKPTYNHTNNNTKKHDYHDGNYFPITMPNFPAQTTQEEFQIWPSARPLGTTEISIDPPPINLPTLVGDLALGPHEKKKNMEAINKLQPQSDMQNCGNFLSVTQLMNRSNENMNTRYQPPIFEPSKTVKQFPIRSNDQNLSHFSSENRKNAAARIENQLPQHGYGFNDHKIVNSYENNNMVSYTQTKLKANKTEKSKSQKNNYSAEALLRGGSCNQKIQDISSAKYMPSSQKYNEFNSTVETGVAQVSHFPPILDYTENSYQQQFPGTNLYNATTNTISNSFYSNFMQNGGNLMTGNYASGPFPGDFIDYNQPTECHNYTSHKYEDLKMRNSSNYQQEKLPSNYKTSRRESATKHKLECSKKETSKKFQSKRTKLNTETEEWNDSSHLLWQNRNSNKRHANLMPEELPFTNYVSNQMASQYQSEFLNSHLVTSNVQTMGHNVDRTLASFSGTSRANFNLSTIFPEITMKVQS